MGYEPSAGQGEAAEHGFVDTEIHPAHFSAHLSSARQTHAGPVIDQCRDSSRAHGAVTQQILVMPHAPADQMGMIFQALIPAPRVLGAYGADVDDEVDEFGLNRHGVPRLVKELKTNALCGVR